MTNRRNPEFPAALPACIGFVIFLILCILFRVRPDRLIGAAFCHQVEARSPEFGFPFCYRCSGLFFGIFWGTLYSFLICGTEKLLSLSDLIRVIVSFILFLADIINTTEYIPIRFYPENISIRFLSSYPLGFFLAIMIVSVFQALFALEKPKQSANKYTILCISCLISYLAAFSRSLPVLRSFGLLISAGSLMFLVILYSILIKCVFMLRGNPLNLKKCVVFSFFPALCQICILGGLHLYLFKFDQLFS